MKRLFPLLALIAAASFSACNTTTSSKEPALNDSETNSATLASTEGLELIQFHSEHRCMTCNKIEALTIATAESLEGITFRLVNVDDAANAEMARQFEAAGTALFVYNPETGEKKELTDFAFMTAHDDEKYIAKLREKIVRFD
ncbi:MAG: hypothetical protein EA392_02690 [Cryomorphaceae bacterium]|nr:MAG: hypothetical protein EA392_02690 [Cryomorphaceae bacterium]